MADFKDRLKELIDENNLTYQAFSERVNQIEGDGAKLSKPVIAAMLKDREPGYKTIVKIARTFDVSTDWLLGITDMPDPVDDTVTISNKEYRQFISDKVRLLFIKECLEKMVYVTGKESNSVE